MPRVRGEMCDMEIKMVIVTKIKCCSFELMNFNIEFYLKEYHKKKVTVRGQICIIHHWSLKEIEKCLNVLENNEMISNESSHAIGKRYIYSMSCCGLMKKCGDEIRGESSSVGR